MNLRSPRTILSATFAAGLLIGVLATTATAALQGSTIFSDVPAGYFGNDAIGRMYGIGVIKGKDAEHFDPNGSLTRGEAAVLLDRLYSALSGNMSSSSVSSMSSSSSSSSSLPSSSSLSSSSSQPSSSSSSGIFSFSASEYTVMENAGNLVVTVVRGGDISAQATVGYSLNSNNTTAGSYSLTNGTLTFAPGVAEKRFNITLNDNGKIDGNRSATLSLHDPSSSASVGAPYNATLVILDDESAPPPVGDAFQLDVPAFRSVKSDGMAYLTVSRSSGLSAASVDYATSNGTASMGREYTTTKGTLSFAIGETAKVFTVPLATDENSIGETFHVQLSNPVGGTLTEPNAATVSIQ